MDHPVTEEESYENRRQLFKNIWDTDLNIDKKDEEKKEGNVTQKPKIIKTARIDEVHRCTVGKKKKQRLKNLRIVCNKILDFCDRQDADDMFYEQMSSKCKRRNKRRMLKKSQQIRKAKAERMFPTRDGSPTGTASPDPFIKFDESSSNSSTMNVEETVLVVQENYRKRRKRKRVENFTDAKMLLRACQKNSNKRLFPINKIYIK